MLILNKLRKKVRNKRGDELAPVFFVEFLCVLGKIYRIYSPWPELLYPDIFEPEFFLSQNFFEAKFFILRTVYFGSKQEEIMVASSVYQKFQWQVF